VGKVLRYKPAKDLIVGGAKEEKKLDSISSSAAVTTHSQLEDLVYDMETDKMIT
jgi:hypothetical protein